jgi:hypothetical protein
MGVFGFCHNASKSGLFTRNVLEQPHSGFRTLTLKFGTKTTMAGTESIYMVSGMYFTIAVNSNINNTKIHSEHIVNIPCWWFFYVAWCKKIELTSMINQIGFALLGL